MLINRSIHHLPSLQPAAALLCVASPSPLAPADAEPHSSTTCHSATAPSRAPSPTGQASPPKPPPPPSSGRTRSRHDAPSSTPPSPPTHDPLDHERCRADCAFAVTLETRRPRSSASVAAMSFPSRTLDPIARSSSVRARREPASSSSLHCCCGRPDCILLKRNCSILESVEKDVHTAAQLGQVRAHGPRQPARARLAPFRCIPAPASLPRSPPSHVFACQPFCSCFWHHDRMFLR